MFIVTLARTLFFFFFLHTFAFQLLDKPWSQVSSLLLPGSCLQFLSRIGLGNPTARRLFIECCLTRALALSPSQFVHKKKSRRIYTSTHSAGLELTKLTYTRLEDNLIRHRGDRSHYPGRYSRLSTPACTTHQQLVPVVGLGATVAVATPKRTMTTTTTTAAS